ncbi:hypothetical protein KIN20_037634 [Parelaphostrongylus tenuis]|uniref:Uncharacterized protein n=1 Tax=Parelaphostrongylus tenuis TaxID=148309 RepID=A0AAD5RE57_PARTN|nr:hypothetical protein KIN20_037634 [Parelaphostrongylus tenuis]
MTHLEPALAFHTPPMPTTPTYVPSGCPGAPRVRGRQRHSTPPESLISGPESRALRMFSFDSPVDETVTEAMDVPPET